MNLVIQGAVKFVLRENEEIGHCVESNQPDSLLAHCFLSLLASL